MTRVPWVAAVLATVAVLFPACSASAMYHPTAGRWISRDPVGYADGMSLKQYCAGKPLSVTDPRGEQGFGGWSMPPRYLMNPTRYWNEAPPLKNRCSKEEEDNCKRKTVSFYSTADPNAEGWKETMEHTKQSGGVSPAGSVADLLSKIDKAVVPCSCVEKLSILAHGGYMGSGGFNLRTSKTESWNMISASDKEGTALVESFAKAVAPVMCSKGCSINIMSCAGGEGNTASIIARLTGCSVRAAKCVGEGGQMGLLAPQREGGVDTTDISEVWEFQPGGGPPTRIMPPETSAGARIW